MDANIQDVDMTKRIVTGFFNSYNYLDSDADIILPGANSKSIAERGPDSSAVQKIKHLVDHDWSKLPGKLQVLEEKSVAGITGIYFETKMSNTTLGNDTLINYHEKIYDNHSFGFKYVDGKYIENGTQDFDKALNSIVNPKDASQLEGIFVWKETKMYEGSTVAFGANALTPYLGVKSNNKESLVLKVSEKILLLEKQLKSGTQSDEMLQSFEMQLKQLNQIITELFSLEPSAKDTLLQGRNTTDTLDFKQLTKIIKQN
jgi:HK97 family phage prohead protease